MDRHETQAKWNLAETCCASLSLNALVNLQPGESSFQLFDTTKSLTYGEIPGVNQLRCDISSLYGDHVSPNNVLITQGAISANYQVLWSFLGPGDHVICHYPTYQQLYSVPKFLGAEVTLWRSDFQRNWLLCLDDLKRALKPNTKMIIIK